MRARQGSGLGIAPGGLGAGLNRPQSPPPLSPAASASSTSDATGNNLLLTPGATGAAAAGDAGDAAASTETSADAAAAPDDAATGAEGGAPPATAAPPPLIKPTPVRLFTPTPGLSWAEEERKDLLERRARLKAEEDKLADGEKEKKIKGPTWEELQAAEREAEERKRALEVSMG